MDTNPLRWLLLDFGPSTSTSMAPSQEYSAPSEVEKSLSEHTNKDGTLHQSELGPKPKRKHFFSPLDPAYADAVHRDAESVEYSAEEEVL